jgi:Phage integrase, N-terminal SAM-like domain
MGKTHQDPLADFKQHLIIAGKSEVTIEEYLRTVRRFLRHVGNERPERISEELTRSFFAGMKSKTRRFYATVVSQFLNFSVSRLPVPVNARGAESPRAPTKKEIALRQRWSVDKLIEQKQSADDLIAKLARKVIDGYLLSQQVVKGNHNLDDFVRFADECRELIETNLPLFMSLSAQGRNIHSAIDERVQTK